MKILALFCGLTVLAAVTADKPGDCPEPGDDSILLNPQSCFNDDQCPGIRKCCGEVCLQPVCDEDDEPVECLQNPCTNLTCSIEGAVCFPDPCSDDCDVMWLLDGRADVSDDCDFDDDDDEDDDKEDLDDDDDDDFDTVEGDDTDLDTDVDLDESDDIDDDDDVDDDTDVDTVVGRKKWKMMTQEERKAFKMERKERKKAAWLARRNKKGTMTRQEKMAKKAAKKARKAERKAAMQGSKVMKLQRKEKKWAWKAGKGKGPFRNLDSDERDALIEEKRAKWAAKKAEKQSLLEEEKAEKESAKEDRRAKWMERKEAKKAAKLEKMKNRGGVRKSKFEKIKARKQRRKMRRQNL